MAKMYFPVTTPQVVLRQCGDWAQGLMRKGDGLGTIIAGMFGEDDSKSPTDKGKNRNDRYYGMPERYHCKYMIAENRVQSRSVQKDARGRDGQKILRTSP
ncbi:hypothetical protein AO703_01845 [[Enterobacter] lignolyticus]|uniref:Uncharacterized protein n=1 Tax=[Enterobacter] lignolyticus TaxID=1334193 RepID=A0A806X239_9ENTR|nr:hypothetical protein AO703_01845 [[Enterobacter] lignolyticus]